ncbi:IS30 family transposase [Burkholderia cenocepacia]|nr:IS30 family transposase [Burkholderia cenocepacia]
MILFANCNEAIDPGSSERAEVWLVSSRRRISERPATSEDRAIPKHRKGDLLLGNASGRISIVVERQNRFVMPVKVAGKDAEAVVNTLIRHASELSPKRYKSLAWDRGMEMANHKGFTVAIDVRVSFRDPRNPGQRDSNENMNGLPRQYFTKSTDVSAYSQAELDTMARGLNQRPSRRKTLILRLSSSINLRHRPVNFAPNASRSFTWSGNNPSHRL